MIGAIRKPIFKSFLKHTEKSIYKESYSYCTKFREKFVGKPDISSWFPGHMYKGTLQLQAKLATVDCIIEVHDARIPFSGRNPKFFSMATAVRPHIFILNKKDLADTSHENEIRQRLQRENNIQHVIFTNCKENKGGIQKIMPLAVELIKDSELFNRGNRTSFVLMVIGIPNVGKSSIINRLRNYHLNKKNASAVGAVPGITKTVLEKIKISDKPSIYLFDTPGIIEPNIDSMEAGLKLALCRTIKDTVVNIELLADYLLYWLNKHKNFRYLAHLDLKEPTDDIRQLIIHIAKHQNKIKRVRDSTNTIVPVPDIYHCCMHFISAFREGKYGRVNLDMDHL